MLNVDDIHVYIEDSYVLEGVTFDVQESEIVTILGRNGVGKTTTLRAVLGHNEVRSGRITHRGDDITGLPPYQISRRGIGWVPQERRIFPELTVEENLVVAMRDQSGDKDIATAYEYFPILGDLQDSKGRNLSGGEQQMLALARGFLGDYELLLIDEPTEGLAPLIIDKVVDALETLSEEMTILVVGQNIDAFQDITDRFYIIEDGQIVAETDDIGRDSALVDEHIVV